MFKPFIILTLTALLAACASSYAPQDAPALPENQTLWFQLEKLDNDGNTTQTSVLSVQGEADGTTRWLQADIFGVPQARLLAKSTGWQKDGFAPPNRTAQQLFVALFPYIKRGFRQPETIVLPEQIWRVSPIHPEAESE